ncbi:4'-phosphopantetheinyl transferase superfamily protein [Parabacteroides sp. OttesenSCG-928-G21]|nr:4'-phosphopantetheinyl transferase superfamily protein [Parabacteroides sp. OttesenSCG-928-G21]
MPLLLKHKQPLTGIWKIEESVDELKTLLGENSLYKTVPPMLKTEKRQKEWLATRLLSRELLGEEIIIEYAENGRPELKDSPFHISISHTTGYVAVLLLNSPFVGIDIETRNNRILKIQKKFLCEKEYKSIDAEHEADHSLIYWSAKEVLFKMLGQEGVDFKQDLHITPFSFKESGILIANETKTAEKQSFQLAFEVMPDYVWVWSLESDD